MRSRRQGSNIHESVADKKWARTDKSLAAWAVLWAGYGPCGSPDDFNVDLFAMFIFTGTHSSVLWRPRARSRYVSKLSQLFYLGVSRLNAHDSLHHDLRCVMCDTPAAGWDGMIVFTFHILLQRSILSWACHGCTADDLTPTTFSSSLCLLSGPGPGLVASLK